MIQRIFSIGLLLFLCSCQTTFYSEKEFFEWLNNPNSGLIKTRKVDGLNITMKYLPAKYLVLKEMNGVFNAKKADSLEKKYANGLTFLLTFSPIDDNTGDVMYKDLQEFEEYASRLKNLQFDIGKYIFIRSTNKEFRPILSTLENTFGVTKHRNIYIVFGGDDKNDILKSKEIDIVLEDDIFVTGIHHFVFDSWRINESPNLSFWKK